MHDLSTISGLPLWLDDEGRLHFGADVVVTETRERLLEELTHVALASDICQGCQDSVYTMFNGVYRRSDAERIVDSGLRYELTLIPPRMIGRELIKTHGHLHNAPPGGNITYAEICEVLVGTAHFFFQTLDPEEPAATHAFFIEAGPGDKVIIPPDLDHLTINASAGPLLFSDVVALGIQGVYDRYQKSGGAAYLEVRDDQTPVFITNPRYRRVPPLQRLTAHNYPAFDLTPNRPLYQAFIEQRGDWGFLREPERFRAAFPDLAAFAGQSVPE